MSQEAIEITYIILWLVALAIVVWPRKRGGELDSDAIITHVVLKNRKSRKVTP